MNIILDLNALNQQISVLRAKVQEFESKLDKDLYNSIFNTEISNRPLFFNDATINMSVYLENFASYTNINPLHRAYYVAYYMNMYQNIIYLNAELAMLNNLHKKLDEVVNNIVPIQAMTSITSTVTDEPKQDATHGFKNEKEIIAFLYNLKKELAKLVNHSIIMPNSKVLNYIKYKDSSYKKMIDSLNQNQILTIINFAYSCYEKRTQISQDKSFLYSHQMYYTLYSRYYLDISGRASDPDLFAKVFSIIPNQVRAYISLSKILISKEIFLIFLKELFNVNLMKKLMHDDTSGRFSKVFINFIKEEGNKLDERHVYEVYSFIFHSLKAYSLTKDDLKNFSRRVNVGFFLLEEFLSYPKLREIIHQNHDKFAKEFQKASKSINNEFAELVTFTMSKIDKLINNNLIVVSSDSDDSSYEGYYAIDDAPKRKAPKRSTSKRNDIDRATESKSKRRKFD